MTQKIPAHMAELQQELKIVCSEFDQKSIEDFRSSEFAMHTGIRKTAAVDKRQNGAGLILDFLAAAAADPFEQFTPAYLKNPALVKTLDREDVQELTEAGGVVEIELAYALSKAYQKRDWQAVCSASFDLAKCAAVLFGLYEAQAGKLGAHSPLYAEMLNTYLHAEITNKYFQLHMVLEAPPEAIQYVWSRESPGDLEIFKPLLQKFAAARGDEAVVKVVEKVLAEVPARTAAMQKLQKQQKGYATLFKTYEKKMAAAFLADLAAGKVSLKDKDTVVEGILADAGDQPGQKSGGLGGILADAFIMADYNSFMRHHAQGGVDVRSYEAGALLDGIYRNYTANMHALATSSEEKDWDKLAALGKKIAADLVIWRDICVQLEERSHDAAAAKQAFLLIDAQWEVLRAFQFYMIMEAPAAAVAKVWAGENAQTVKTFAKALTAIAAQRGDADVTRAVDALITPAAPPKKPRGPKK